MKKLFTLLALGLLSMSLFAKDKKISGIVVDEKGEPIVGASVQVTGTTLGTISDYDGLFELTVPESAKTLTVSYIGMQTQEVAVKTNLRITLRESSEVLQEVIAVAYGNTPKGSFAGSAQAVNAETIEKKSPSEISKALAGEVAGVQVVNTSGQPGTNATIRIRGIGSVNASSTPLYVVDGIPYDGDVSAIDPGDIASTTILKDATATSLYGSRGANGVILITTKKGTSGEEGKIDVDVKYGANMHLLPMYDVISDPQQYVELAWQGIYNSQAASYGNNEAMLIAAVNRMLFDGKQGMSPAYNLWNTDGASLINGYTGKFYPEVALQPQYKNMTTWEDAIFRVGQKAEATVKISGGNEQTTYYTSFGYLKDEGYYIGSDYDRFTARVNVQHQAKKWLKGSANMAYTYSTLNNPGQDDNMNNGFAFVNGMPAIYPVYLYNADGSIQIDPKTGNYAYDYGERESIRGRAYGYGINPAGSLLYDKQKTIQHQFTGNASLEIKFYKDLKLTANVGVQYLGVNTSALTNPYYGDAANIGRIYKGQANYLSLTANQLLEYNKTIDEHTIRAMVGHETNFLTQSTMYGQKSMIAAPESLEWGNAVQMDAMSSSTAQLAIESYLATVSYDYDGRYLLTANYRADGSSKFAKGHRWGHFGSIGGAWVFTNESFMQDVNWLKNGKLRLSWGMLGNQGVSMNLYQDQYSIEYVDGEVAYVWQYKGNPDLTWERTSTVDVGLEFDISKYLTAEIDYFYKHTDNMLFPRYVAPSMGYSYEYINGGKMMNQGVEFQFNVHAVDTRNVKLDIRLNGAHYVNRILELPKGIDDDAENMITNGGLAVGHSLYDYQMRTYAGVDPTTGLAQYVVYYDKGIGEFANDYGQPAETMLLNNQKGSNYISDVFLYKKEHPEAEIGQAYSTRATYAGTDYIGKSALPALDGGFGIDLEVYGVTLSASCSYRIGGYGYDNTYALLMHSDKAGSYNWHKDMLDAWSPWNKSTLQAEAVNQIPRLSNGTDTYANAVSTRFLTSNSYLSLNNVRVGYNFPKKLIEKIKLNSLSIYVSGDNLCIATARKGYNPMVSFAGSSDSYQYTPLSTIMGGIKFQF